MASGHEAGKRAAAFRAVDVHVTRPGMRIGVGSGSTVVYVVERLAQLQSAFFPLICVPTSFQSRQLLVAAKLAVADLDAEPVLDVVLDGADEVDPNLDCIKGGGGCHTQEKIVASCTDTFVIVADVRKQSQALGRLWRSGVPVEIVPCALRPVEVRLRALGGQPTLRIGVNKAGPVVTDNGGWILDVDFGEIRDAPTLDAELRKVVGVVEHGLFVGMATECYFGLENGTVVELRRSRTTKL